MAPMQQWSSYLINVSQLVRARGHLEDGYLFLHIGATNEMVWVKWKVKASKNSARDGWWRVASGARQQTSELRIFRKWLFIGSSLYEVPKLNGWCFLSTSEGKTCSIIPSLLLWGFIFLWIYPAVESTGKRAGSFSSVTLKLNRAGVFFFRFPSLLIHISRVRKASSVFSCLRSFKWIISSTCLPNDRMSALARFQTRRRRQSVVTGSWASLFSIRATVAFVVVFFYHQLYNHNKRSNICAPFDPFVLKFYFSLFWVGALCWCGFETES